MKDDVYFSDQKLKNLEQEIKPWYRNILDWIVNKLQPVVQFFTKIINWWKWNWFGLSMVVMILAIFGMCTSGIIHEEKRKIADRATWETKENFVKRQGKYYIYREEIEGHQYYIYKYENEYGHLVDWTVVPVNTCTDTIWPVE